MPLPIIGGGSSSPAGGGELTLGKTDEGGTNGYSANQIRCGKFTATSTFTATYGYFYGYNGGGASNIVLYVMNSDQSGQVGVCSNSVALPSGSPAWVEVTFDPGISIVDTNVYWICRAVTNCQEYYDTVTSGDSKYSVSGSCPTAAGTDSTRGQSMFISNYNAH